MNESLIYAIWCECVFARERKKEKGKDRRRRREKIETEVMESHRRRERIKELCDVLRHTLYVTQQQYKVTTDTIYLIVLASTVLCISCAFAML